MKTDEIAAIFENLKKIKDYDAINRLLDKVSEHELVNLTKKILEDTLLFDCAHVLVINRLFDDTHEFAKLLNEFFEKSNWAGRALYKPLKEKVIENQKIAFSLIKKMMHMGDPPGVSSGILLAWLVEEMNDARKFMKDGIASEESDLQRCSLVALRSNICNPNTHENREYLDLLKENAQRILPENSGLLIICLQCAFEVNNDEFGSILKSELERRGAKAATSYIRTVFSQETFSISLLQKAVKLLEAENPDSIYIDHGGWSK